MSKFQTWREEFEHKLNVTSVELALLEDLINGKIEPTSAAKLFTKNVDLTEEFYSPLYHVMIIASTLAVCSLDSAVQQIIVQLASEIRTLRKRSLHLEDEIPLNEVLGEMEEVIADWWASLWSASLDMRRAEEHPRWISINEFTARLTKADVCDWTHNATFLFDDLLDKPKLRENPILFSVTLSAAAQYMVHAAFNVLSLCKKHRGCQGQKYRWEEWMAVFKEAGTVENIRARNDALSAVVAMESAEQLYNSLQMKGKPASPPRAMSSQLGHNEDLGGEQQENVCKAGIKRAIEEAFPVYYESGTRAKATHNTVDPV